MRKTIKIIARVVAVILLIDATGFAFWVLSGQLPIDNFYIGTMTAYVLRIVL